MFTTLKGFLISIILVVVSFTIGHQLGSSKNVTEPSTPVVVEAQTTNQVQKKFEELAHVDYQEYLNLKSAEEKYKKADEILEKIMQIFLADLGIHIARKSPELAQALPSPTLAPTSAPVSHTPKPVVQNSHYPRRNLYPLGNLTVFLSNINDENKAKSFLRNNEIKDFKHVLVETKVLTIPPKSLVGCFKGDVKLKNGRTWQMSMIHEYEDVSSSNKGDYAIIITDDRGKNSRTSGIGYGKDILGNPEHPEEIILKASPSEYFQLFFLPNMDAFTGNLYQKQKDEEYKLMGTTILNRATGCSFN